MLYEKIKLEEDEKVIVTVRRHWWVIFLHFFSVAIIAWLPLLIYLLITRINVSLVAIDISTVLADYGIYLFFFYTVWVFISWIILFNAWTDYYLDLWVVTTKRVILIDQRGLFSRFVASFRLDRLQDMNIEVNGVISTFLNFGTIEAQTAGGENNHEFRSRNMPDPRNLKAIIVKAADERYKATHQNTDRQTGL